MIIGQYSCGKLRETVAEGEPEKEEESLITADLSNISACTCPAVTAAPASIGYASLVLQYVIIFPILAEA